MQFKKSLYRRKNEKKKIIVLYLVLETSPKLRDSNS